MASSSVTYFEHMGDAERYVDKLFDNRCDLRRALFAARRDRIKNPKYCTAAVVDIGDDTDVLHVDYCYKTELLPCVFSEPVEVDRSHWSCECCCNGVWERFEVYDGE